jgi:Cu(I)/Ag(I) efflux system membrane fusion protein
MMKGGMMKIGPGTYRWRTVAIVCAAAASLIVVGLVGGYSIGRGGKEATIEGEHTAGESHEAQVWTCSMHPQIRQPKPGRCPICAMDLIPVTETGAGEVGNRELRLSPAARKLAEIQTVPVERRPVTAEVRMVGKVEYDETRVSYITSWVPGRLERLYVDYTGVAVKQGDPMVAVYSPELVAAQEELLQSIKAAEQLQASDVEILKRAADQTVGAVREKLRLWGLKVEQIAEIEARGTVAETVVIRAPAGGVVVEKNAFEGQYVTTGTRIYTIADLSHVWVKLDAYESDLPWVRPGQHVRFSAEAYPGETFEGKIAFIDPVLDSGTRTAKVRVNLDNPDGQLKPEMFVRGIIEARMETASDGEPPLVIPASAPLITGKRAVVYLETEPGLYAGREVTLGPRTGDFYIVEAGLEEGQRVVTRGNFKIDSAIQILAKPSMMNPEGGGSLPGHEHGLRQVSAGGTAREQDDGAPLDVPEEFGAQLARVFEAYLGIHHGLSRDSLDEARTAATTLEEVLKVVDMGLLAEPAHTAWMGYLGKLRGGAEKIRAAEEIEAARAAFAPLSQTVYETLRRLGTRADTEAYLFYCSMAFDGQGASWLQSTREIENPYYGAAMFRCGEMREPVTSVGPGTHAEHDHD